MFFRNLKNSKKEKKTRIEHATSIVDTAPISVLSSIQREYDIHPKKLLSKLGIFFDFFSSSLV